MTINIYLIRLLIAFIFGASAIITALGIYFGMSAGWNSANQLLTIAAHLFALAVFIGSGYLLWVIK